MPISDADVTRIMERLRDGETFSHSEHGGRYVMTWSYAGGEWLVDDWQEGSSQVARLSESEMRASIAAAPASAFRRLPGR